ncbi:MAG: hypothetical protein F9K27_12155 [Anaerolineae bacterium]|nr:MAG: hypothetical protein F9K27_12155 [Anaerolineae bacterium]
MNLLNFSHPLNKVQLEQLAKLIGQPITDVRDIAVQFDTDQTFTPQVVAMIDNLSIESVRWQNEPWLIIPPALNYITAILLAELHARMGHFPTIIRLKPVQQNFTTQYDVAEIINLEQVRQIARQRR